MGKFDGILICTDLDGTLYKNDKTISEENKAAIEYFKGEGGYFTFITGRMPYYSDKAYNDVNPNALIGCINGGAIYDGVEKEYIWKKALSQDVLELVECVDAHFPEVGIKLCCFDNVYVAKENAATGHITASKGVIQIPCDYHGFDKPIGKVMFSTDKAEEIEGMKKLLAGHKKSAEFTLVHSEPTLFEILPKGINKGFALQKLAECLNISIDRTIAIGDYDNDAPMLKAAGAGIAVSNASQAALDAARFVTVSNEEHAIARIISDLENGKYV